MIFNLKLEERMYCIQGALKGCGWKQSKPAFGPKCSRKEPAPLVHPEGVGAQSGFTRERPDSPGSVDHRRQSRLWSAIQSQAGNARRLRTRQFALPSLLERVDSSPGGGKN